MRIFFPFVRKLLPNKSIFMLLVRMKMIILYASGALYTLKYQVLVDGFLSVEYEKVKKILNGLYKMNLENVEFNDSKVL